MSIVSIHIGHLSDIEYLERSIVADSVELVIVPIKLNRSDTVSVTNEGLNLFLVVNVPNSDDSIFAT